MDKLSYIKKMFSWREQNRWNLSDIDDAGTLLMEMEELMWLYHHLSLLKYRNHKHKEFHDLWGVYSGIKISKELLFPVIGGSDLYSRRLYMLQKETESEDMFIINSLQ